MRHNGFVDEVAHTWLELGLRGKEAIRAEREIKTHADAIELKQLRTGAYHKLRKLDKPQIRAIDAWTCVKRLPRKGALSVIESIE